MPFTIPPPPTPEHFLTLNEIVDLMRGIVKRVNTDLDTPEQPPDMSLIPVLTTYAGIGSGNSVSGTISAISNEASPFPSWKACDGNLTTGYQPSGSWVGAGVIFQFEKQVTASSWSYLFQKNTTTALRGSNDGIVYTLVDNISSSTVSGTRTIASTTYTFWKLSVTGDAGSILYFQLFI
jgi:hypothetical protein